mmetsp:Transcript_42453/g.51475  ORF Transcript_42453/g.51475 Transcript_42453/m.51475 type:complete len:597 (+) Transcript_42453:320-2110(+)|eukprot:CAMPEP_0197855200 /NCGR_PEP_ID=MMETSP1438-20131217/26151_1 /TAXON_ID=1461541 /ORGANISM="Pterosperma sp., Strain CCMP1384" /LENGTH=596 /DNA_ID=CAMNT_0043470215 /DNA_START=239 /DNA_END=2029 /DNA_ORIENTATION=-
MSRGSCLDKSLFTNTDAIHPTLLCGINLGVMQSPCRTPCDHLFCESCIREWLAHGNNTCPTCREHLTEHDLKKDRNIDAIVSDLQVQCNDGCDWEGRMEDLQKHLEDCPHALVKCCWQGCLKQIQRRDLESHASSCEFRDEECPHCYDKFPANKMELHFEECGRLPMQCELGCNAVDIPREKMNEHLDKYCPNVPVACPFAQQGCDAKITRSQLSSHLETAQQAHMLCLCSAFQAQQAELEELKNWKASQLVRNLRRGNPVVHVLEGHQESMNCVQFDDKLLVSGSLDKTLRVWDLQTWEARHVLTGHEATVWCLQYVHNILVSASGDKTLRVWCLQKGECLRVLEGHNGDVYCLQFDGETVVSGSRDGTLRVWNTISGKCRHLLQGHTDYVLGVKFEKDCIVSCSSDNTLRMWSMESGQCTRVFQGHSDSVWCMQFNQTILVSGSDDNKLRVWDMSSGACLHVLEGHSDHVYCLQLEGNTLVSGSDDSTLRVWDIVSGKCRHTLKGHDSSVWCLQLEGTTLISGSGDGTICIWDVPTGSCLRQLRGHTATVIRCCFRGNRLVSCSSDSTLRVWDFDEVPSASECDREKDRKSLLA